MDRTKNRPDVIAATAEHYDALDRAQERLARAWDGEPAEIEVPPSDPPPVEHQTGGCPPEQRDACVLCRKHPRMDYGWSIQDYRLKPTEP